MDQAHYSTHCGPTSVAWPSERRLYDFVCESKNLHPAVLKDCNSKISDINVLALSHPAGQLQLAARVQGEGSGLVNASFECENRPLLKTRETAAIQGSCYQPSGWAHRGPEKPRM